jgi:hypothetical protein
VQVLPAHAQPSSGTFAGGELGHREGGNDAGALNIFDEEQAALTRVHHT